MVDRSSAGAEKASLTPSKSPMCSAVVVVVVVGVRDVDLLLVLLLLVDPTAIMG